MKNRIMDIKAISLKIFTVFTCAGVITISSSVTHAGAIARSLGFKGKSGSVGAVEQVKQLRSIERLNDSVSVEPGGLGSWSREQAESILEQIRSANEVRDEDEKYLFEYFVEADSDSIVEGMDAYIQHRKLREPAYDPSSDPIFRYYSLDDSKVSITCDFSLETCSEKVVLAVSDFWSCHQSGGCRGQVLSLTHKETHEQFFFKKRGLLKRNLNMVRHQVASYLLSQMLGLDVVGPTQCAVWEGEAGSLQRGVPPEFTRGFGHYDGNPELTDPRYQVALNELKVFDHIANSDDRHSGNLFFNGESGEVKSIDHDESFGIGLVCHLKTHEFSPSAFPSFYSSKMVAQIRRSTIQKLNHTFRKWLAPDEIESMWLRVLILRQDMKKKRVEHEKAAQVGSSDQ